MKPILVSIAASAAFAFFGVQALAQGVYVTPGEHGPVFSDKPRAGSKEVTLKPLNVIPAQPEPPPAAKAVPETGTPRAVAPSAASFYRSFAIVSPENNGSVAGNTATLEVRLAADPPLALGEGHAFVVRINGRFVDQRFTATEFSIPPEFWTEGFVPANQSMQLDASIIDAAGQVLQRAAPVVFRTRQVVVMPGYAPGNPGHVFPHPRPAKPAVKPKASEPATDFPGAAIKR